MVFSRKRSLCVATCSLLVGLSLTPYGVSQPKKVFAESLPLQTSLIPVNTYKPVDLSSMSTDNLLSVTKSGNKAEVSLSQINSGSNLSILNVLGVDADGTRSTSYSWSAKVDGIEVNKGTVEFLFKGNTCIEVDIASNSPVDSSTALSISLPDEIKSNLSKIYTYNSTLNKFVASDASAVSSDGLLVFNGTGKCRYLLSATSLDNVSIGKQGWNSVLSSNGNDYNWYYLCGEDCVTGWKQDTDGKWYYLNKNGVMLRNTLVQGYVLGQDGAML